MLLKPQIRLSSRPVGVSQRDNFDVVDAPLPEIKGARVYRA